VRQAIQTRFLGPTDRRGAHIKAFASAGSLTLPWDQRLNPEGNHTAAARACRAPRLVGRLVRRDAAERGQRVRPRLGRSVQHRHVVRRGRLTLQIVK
jgi:hypothetical protein